MRALATVFFALNSLRKIGDGAEWSELSPIARPTKSFPEASPVSNVASGL